MKAAILYQLGEAPKYGDFPDPIPKSDEQVVMTMKAAAVKNLDKGKASGAHYSASTSNEPTVVGIDGVGILEDGTRGYAMGISGMLACKALIRKHSFVALPAGLDDVTAAALPNAIFGAAGALRFRAAIKPGEVVLINGATGVTGMVAVQVAKHYGAKKVIVTGRNQHALEQLLTLGADDIVSLKGTDEEIIKQLKAIYAVAPVDVVIDYLWGHPAELVLASLAGKGDATHRLRIITVGGMAGDTIQLSSSVLRSSDIQIMGSGLGSISREEMQQLFTTVLPEMLQLAVDGKLRIDTVTAKLEDVEKAWDMEVGAGKRLVIVI